MDTIANERNGATWIRDCLLDGAVLERAVTRLQANCQDGIRHFSAIGKTVRLDQARQMEIEISRDEED